MGGLKFFYAQALANLFSQFLSARGVILGVTSCPPTFQEAKTAHAAALLLKMEAAHL